MNNIKVFVETGKKKTFVGAVDWPGWSRGGRNEEAALQALWTYGARYGQVLQDSGIGFQIPADVSDFVVVESVVGNATTDFGAPAAMLEADKKLVDQAELARFQTILQACWDAFDTAIQQAEGIALRKGPRSGGRDLDKIVTHVLQSDRSYLPRLAWRYKTVKGESVDDGLVRMRQAVLNALETAVMQGLPEKGPRGGKIWTPRFFVRRVAWHTLDHVWEIEDRI